ncbi:MAG: LysM peptidoglycan-binding domain-containing protein [Bacteroidales bacterium]|nr:LysM peptidoglycan-binding domain-containing protein [Bacteroidales bacterium]
MMKTKIIVLLAALMWVNGLFAQAESWPKDTVDGVVVYRYTVQKSEGLYRISKNFNVSQEELVRLNPKLQTEGLKLGQVILVPVKEEQPAAADSSMVKHVIEPKETLYAISKRYGVSVAELQAANPEVSKNMPIGATLLIPVRAAEGATLPVPQTQAEAPKMDAPQPQSEAPKVETPKAEAEAPTIEAPKADEVVLPAPKLQADSLTAVLQVATDSMVEHPLLLPYDSSIISALPLRIAYLLPFQVEAAKRDGQMDRFIDFYEGALLAIYEAQACGQHFEIFTYDVQKSDIAIQKVLKKGEMQNLDAIIGPAYPAQVSHAALFAKQNRIPCIIPFTNKVSGLEHNPYLMQFNPSAQKEAEAAVRLLSAHKDSLQLVFVDPQASEVSPFVSTLREKALAAGFTTADIALQTIINDSLTTILKQDKKNILVFNSDKYVSVNAVMSKVVNQKKGHSLALFGRYSWQHEKCPIEMVYVSIFHEPNTAHMASYEALYKQYFGHALSSLQPRYDLLGYDLTKAVIRHLLLSQQAVSDQDKQHVFAEEHIGLQSDIHYERASEEGGLENIGIKLIWK